jgi:uncharacterized repeat protein (TIGR01451 family)
MSDPRAKHVRFFLVVVFLTLMTTSAQAALTIAVKANPGYAAPNEGVPIEITVTNTSTTQELGVTVSMPVPTGVNGISESLISGPYTNNCPGSSCESGEIMDWVLGTMNPGQATSFSLPTVVTGGTADATPIDFPGTVLQNAVAQDSQTATVTVDSDAPLRLTIDENHDPVESDGDLIYTLHYCNRAASSVTSSNLSFPIPANTTFVSA